MKFRRHYSGKITCKREYIDAVITFSLKMDFIPDLSGSY